jgi:hypothetical protein
MCGVDAGRQVYTQKGEICQTPNVRHNSRRATLAVQTY